MTDADGRRGDLSEAEREPWIYWPCIRCTPCPFPRWFCSISNGGISNGWKERLKICVLPFFSFSPPKEVIYIFPHLKFCPSFLFQVCTLFAIYHSEWKRQCGARQRNTQMSNIYQKPGAYTQKLNIFVVQLNPAFHDCPNILTPPPHPPLALF